jgi:hypothetical protein
MLKPWRWLSVSVAGLLMGAGAGAVSTTTLTATTATPVSAQEEQTAAFPDVAADYWAQPFIQELAARGIVEGYLDNTYRPENVIDRDEYAAILRRAFSPAQERSIASGSAFDDVPQGYWASTPIEEAYETGFMQDFSPDSQRLFRPKQEMSRLEALMALNRGLGLEYEAPRTEAQVQTNRPVARNRLAFPMAFTSLMPSFLVTQPAQAAQPQPGTLSAREYVQRYYQDADQIPETAVGAIAALTQNNVIVSYPDPQQLNLQEPLKRGTAAALIYQTLTAQGQLEPLAEDVEATQYVAGQ